MSESASPTTEELRQQQERVATQASLDEQELARKAMADRAKLAEEREAAAAKNVSSSTQTKVTKK